MESDEGKLFVGGIAWDTTEEKLRDYFGQYGDVSQAVIMRDKTTGRPRGFGFVVFSDPSLLDRVLDDKHTIDGRTVEAKRALSREEQQTSSKPGNFSSGRNSGGGGNFKTKKIFVGGLPSSLTEDAFRQFFESFGHVTDVVIMYDQNTQRPRGFGFITFDTEDAVDRVLYKNYHELNGKLVEVKRALPKDANPGGGGRGGGYQGYSGAGTNTFESRMDGNRYMQPQTAAGGFPPYSGGEFKSAAATQFGSGWAWLVYKANRLDVGNAVNPNPSEQDKKLAIVKSPNTMNPLVWDIFPLLTIDVWEHAYYLDFQNQRADYISVFVEKLVSWDAASSRLEAAKAKAAEREKEDERRRSEEKEEASGNEAAEMYEAE